MNPSAEAIMDRAHSGTLQRNVSVNSIGLGHRVGRSTPGPAEVHGYSTPHGHNDTRYSETSRFSPMPEHHYQYGNGGRGSPAPTLSTGVGLYRNASPVRSTQIFMTPGSPINSSPKKDYYGRRGTLKHKQGVMLAMSPEPTMDEEREVMELAKTHKPLPLEMTYGPPRPKPKPFIPKYVDLDKKVLRFYAYFKEPITESTDEFGFRVRKVNVHIYEVDNSIEIYEPHVVNSGMPGGVFKSRSRTLKPNSDHEHFGPNDFRVGGSFEINGVVMAIYDCDDYTRSFYESIGQTQPSKQEMPGDSFHESRAKNETMLQTHIPKNANDKLARYLRDDRKILRFFGYENVGSAAVPRYEYYTVIYFLADDTISVRIHHPEFEDVANTMEFSQVVSRKKITTPMSKFRSLETLGPSLFREQHFLTINDLEIGQEYNIDGKKIMLYDCDGYTKTYLKDTRGYSDDQLVRPPPEFRRVEEQTVFIPPHAGFGSDEDSIRSVLYLNPKPAKSNFLKGVEYEGCVLRFVARSAENTFNESLRRFIVQFFVRSDEVLVYELKQRNMGSMGGKFLERGKYVNMRTREVFKPSDFYVGATIEMKQATFELIEADKFTVNFMKTHSELFPGNQVASICDTCKIFLEGPRGKHFKDDLQRHDKYNRGFITPQEFQQCVKDNGVLLKDSEVGALLRHFSSAEVEDRVTLFDYVSFARMAIPQSTAPSRASSRRASSRGSNYGVTQDNIPN